MAKWMESPCSWTVWLKRPKASSSSTGSNPHNFVGPTESGLIKMIAIGLGNQIGAEHYHRLSVVRDQYQIISAAGRELLKRCRVLFGWALSKTKSMRLQW